MQNEQVEIKATAYHDNTLSFVRLYVNENQVGTDQSYNSSNNYTFTFETNSNMVGDIVVSVEAGAFNKPDNIGFDLIPLKVGGILPKSGGM